MIVSDSENLDLNNLALMRHFPQIVIDRLVGNGAYFIHCLANHYGGWEVFHSLGVLCVPRYALVKLMRGGRD